MVDIRYSMSCADWSQGYRKIIDKVGDLDALICYGEYQNKTSNVYGFPNFWLTISVGISVY